MSDDAVGWVQRIMDAAMERRASDVHVEPVENGYEARLRVDGVLGSEFSLSVDAGRAVVLRLMVLARLLTYRLDVPQEGRAPWSTRDGQAIDLRISIMPTARGLRAAVRLPAELLQPQSLETLGLPEPIRAALDSYARHGAGMLVVTGSAGSGKTTTLYALLSRIATLDPGLSVISIEDPVERRLPGVTQIEVTPFGELNFERALRSVLRQDPQVLMLGEIRDADTASVAVNAAMTGHRLLCSMHADDPAAAVTRLLEMGIAPYQLTAALWGVLSQRLLRRRDQQGYRGRVPVAELARLDGALRERILRRADVASLRETISRQPSHTTMRAVADRLVDAGVTDQAEVRRVLGDGGT